MTKEKLFSFQQVLSSPVFAFFFAVGAGVLFLGRPSFWYDEAATVSAARRPVAEIIDLVGNVDLVHAAYYFVIHQWAGIFGFSEFSLRFPSVLAFALAAAGFALFISHFDRRPHLITPIAVVAFIVCPGIYWASGEARGYAFCLAAVCWANVALVKALAAKHLRAVLCWLAYAVLLILATAFLLYAPLIGFFHATLVWMYFQRDRVSAKLLGFGISWLFCAAVAIPFALGCWQQRAQVAHLSDSWPRILVKVGLGQVFMGPRTQNVLWQILAVAALIVCVVLVVILLPRILAGSWRRQELLLALVWLVSPMLVIVGAKLLGHNFYAERYLIFANPGACWLVAELIVRGRLWNRRLADVLAVILLLACLGSTSFQRALLGSKAGQNYRELAQFSRGASRVAFVDTDSRGIAIAYPNLMDGEDVLLAETPVESDTLYGKNLRPEPLAGSGEVVVYFDTTRPYQLEDYRAIALSSCVEEDAIQHAQYSAARFSCPL